MIEFIVRSKYVDDVSFDGCFIIDDYIEYMWETHDYDFETINDFKINLLDNLVEHKYDIISYLENNYFLENLLENNMILSEIGVEDQKGIQKFLDTKTEIIIKYTQEF